MLLACNTDRNVGLWHQASQAYLTFMIIETCKRKWRQ